MSLSGKLTPLAVNTLGSLLSNTGLTINATATSFMGASTSVSTYTSGTLVNNTAWTDLIGSASSKGAYRLGYEKYAATAITESTYRNLLSIGSASIPALGCTPSSSYNYLPSTDSTSGWQEKWGYGFIRLIADQAYQDFYLNNGSYGDFLASFIQFHSYKEQANKTIASLSNSLTFLDGVYSNMNDLASADITGVNISTVYWGQDLIKVGRAIDLSKIDTFGNPADLLLSIQANNALTPAVSLALLSSGLTTSELGEILGKIAPASVEQQRKIYAAFTLIVNNDLKDVLIPLNCTTDGLTMLADLLNPAKLFPNSYVSLTVPKYNAIQVPTNSKTYFLIYSGTGINTSLAEYNERLAGIIPDDLAIACGALSIAMMQIKRIKTMNIEKFAQVVANLETMTGLDVNGTSAPTDNTLANAGISLMAKGSGSSGTYVMADFLGTMSGVNYDYAKLQELILILQTPALVTAIGNIKTLLAGAGPYTSLQSLIDAANTEIANIAASNKPQIAELNTLWNTICNNLKIEQAARALVLPATLTDLTGSIVDIQSFVSSMNAYASETKLYEAAQVIEAISDLTNVSGQSIVGNMREIRNAKRIGLVGGELDNDIPDEMPVEPVNRLGIPKETGAATEPGSLAGSPQQTLIPENLSIFNITGVVLPSVVRPDQAVEDVTLCNCDCWDLVT